MKRLVWSLLLICSSTLGQTIDTRNIWLNQSVLDSLPTAGPAWQKIVSAKNQSTTSPNIIDQNDNTEQYVVAKALYWRKFPSETRYRDEVIAACNAAIDTEKGGRTLALGRNLCGYVVAADLVGFRGTDFLTWTRECLTEQLGSGVSRDLKTTAKKRPNNWGTMAFGSWAAVAVYLDDQAELNECTLHFKAFLGDRTVYTGFSFGDLDWQSNPSQPRGINPVGATIQGHSVDGVVPDDQRRDGGFVWPPTQVNYVYEGGQGTVTCAQILSNAGFDVFNWESKAILRMYKWLHNEANFPCSDNGDEWQIYIVNLNYGSQANFPEFSAGVGRIMSWTEWTHGERTSTTPPPPPPNTLTVNPTNLNFTYTIGGTVPSSKSITVSSTNPIAFNVAVSQTWTTLNKTNGTTPTTVLVGINPTGLSAGTYNSIVGFTSSINNPQVNIQLVVSSTPTPDPDPDPTPGDNKLDIKLLAGSDDAEERLSGSVSLADGDFNLPSSTENKAVGLSFPTVNIPKGTTIKNAHIKFMVNGVSTGLSSINIHGHAVDNSSTFTNAVKFNVSARPKTVSTVIWTPVDWNITKVIQTTSDITPIVQEIVNRPGWNPGNRITIILSGTGRREADSFETSGENSATLHIEY